MSDEMVLRKGSPTDEELNALILRWSVLAGVADVTPIVGADVAAVAGCQMKLFFEMAEKYDVHVTKERFREVLATLAAGVGGWAVTIFGASAMIKAFPGIGNALLFWPAASCRSVYMGYGTSPKELFPAYKRRKDLGQKGSESGYEDDQNWGQVNYVQVRGLIFR